jgi:hypothetical protein
MTHERRYSDAEMRARALSRWEGEGGALAPTGDSDSIDESELRILARLGAAVLDVWGDLSAPVQDEVVSLAKRLGTQDHARVKERLRRLPCARNTRRFKAISGIPRQRELS